MKKQKKSQMMQGVMLAVFGVGMVLAIFGLSRTVASVDEVAISKEPEAILASAGVESGTDVSLPVAYFDQRSDECANLYDLNKAAEGRQFEWTSCGYYKKKIEQGLVKHELDGRFLPAATGEGELLANRGLKDISRWFSAVEGKSAAYSGNIKLEYRSDEGAEFSFKSDEFYPLDQAEFSQGDGVNKDGHNHLFTLNLAVPFTARANGSESFEITADDDTFVFVGNELAIDMGGIHEATTGRLAINEAGEVYTGTMDEELAYSGIRVKEGDGAIIRIFHADRDSADSVFKLKLTGMNLNVMKTQLAGTDGVQVAYDPGNPSYVAPLGETSVVRPDGTKGYMIAATILAVVVVTCAMFAAITAHTLIKNRQQK